MAELKNDCFLRALMRQSTEYTPVWMMRQAGRYLPEYRKIRTTAGDFMSLCQNPLLACEVTLQPLERYPLDAAILFSDILTIPDAMGLGLYFEQGEGPKFRKVVDEKNIGNIKVPNIKKELDYVFQAIKLIRSELNGSVPLIGFSGSPWTLATYMIEGGSSKDFRHIKAIMYNKPELLHYLLDVLSKSVIDYLNEQIKAGAQAVQIFDTWGGVLSQSCFLEFSLGYIKKVVNGLLRENEGREVPVIVFTKNGGQWLESLVTTGAHALGLDWTTEIRNARKMVGQSVALQGNMDPSVLYASESVIKKEVFSILDSYGYGSGHIFNLGHGIHQYTDPKRVIAFVNAVHDLSVDYH